MRRPWGLTVLGRFTLTSALVATSFALALGWLVSEEVTRATLDEAITNTAQAADSLLSPYLVAGDFAHPLWPGRLDDLDRMIGPHLSERGIVRVKLWNRKGVVIYSNDRRVVGRLFALSDELQAALAGRVAAEIRPPGKDENEEERTHGRLLHVYVPVRRPGVAQPEGAYEVYRDARPLLTQIRAARGRVWLLVFVGTAVLYASLIGLVRRASKTVIEQQESLRDAFEGTIQSLATALDAKDTYTGGHSSQVSRYGETIARALGLPEPDVQVVRMAGFLHDLGKIGIPDRLLRKTGPLDEREWAAIRHHSQIGYQILQPVPIDDRIKLAVRHNHERWDGTGYPDGLVGEAIPIHARILMVADAFEAMTSARPYRKGLDEAHAIAELQQSAGTQFDPGVVGAFVRLLKEPQTDRAVETVVVKASI